MVLSGKTSLLYLLLRIEWIVKPSVMGSLDVRVELSALLFLQSLWPEIFSVGVCASY